MKGRYFTATIDRYTTKTQFNPILATLQKRLETTFVKNGTRDALRLARFRWGGNVLASLFLNLPEQRKRHAKRPLRKSKSSNLTERSALS